MSVLRFSPTCSLDPLLLLCLISLRVMEVKAKVTGVQARTQLDAVVEAKRGAKAATPLLQVRAKAPIVLLARSGWLASVNVLCACFGIRASAIWRTASTSTFVVWQQMASLAWVISVRMSARPPHIEGARRIFRRFLRAVMVSLTICFRILLASLLRRQCRQLGPHPCRLRLFQLKQEGLPWEPWLLFLLQEFWMPLFRNCQYLPQAWLLQSPHPLRQHAFFLTFAVGLLAHCPRLPFAMRSPASVSIFYWTVPMIYFRMSSTSPCCDGFFSSLWQVRLVAISVELSFALEVLSHSGLRSSLLGFRAYQDVISSALRPVALFFNAWFRFCLLFSVQADMSALSSLHRHFLGRILLCKIFLRKRQQFACFLGA